ncbi:MAG: XRE family transcriptional regulator [Acidobacteria bacterium]|nr:XRE family transcriptional regulator [Acidobacteriota bacterium]
MLFHALREALLTEIRDTIRAGTFTERSLARFLGVSQPHIHNVLNGSRSLTFHLADHIITKLEIPWETLISIATPGKK